MERMAKEYGIAELCEVFEASRSGYYSYLRGPERHRHREDQMLLGHIQQAFYQNRRVYGVPRIRKELRKEGIYCGKNRIHRLMRSCGLRAQQKRRWRPKTTQNDPALPVAQNWLLKVPAAAAPDQIWLSDITYLWTREGWLYLAGILDACSRYCIGWSVREDLSAELVVEAWNKACHARRPGPGLLHHSDRGSQYACTAFKAVLQNQGATASMSRKGNCYDNAMMESFWATLKTECFGSYVPKTKKEAVAMIFDYIEAFYNTTRMHSSLNDQSPLEFENQLNYKN